MRFAGSAGYSIPIFSLLFAGYCLIQNKPSLQSGGTSLAIPNSTKTILTSTSFPAQCMLPPLMRAGISRRFNPVSSRTNYSVPKHPYNGLLWDRRSRFTTATRTGQTSSTISTRSIGSPTLLSQTTGDSQICRAMQTLATKTNAPNCYTSTVEGKGSVEGRGRFQVFTISPPFSGKQVRVWTYRLGNL